MLNKANQQNIATFSQMRPFFADDGIYRGSTCLSLDGKAEYVKTSDLLYAFSPSIPKTVGALESSLPLVDLPVENDKAYFKGEFSGETVFIVGSKDKLIEAAKIAITDAGIKAGLNEPQINQQILEKLSTPGVFVATESNYDIVGASTDGNSYTILADDMPAEQLAQVFKFYFGNFKNGQKRKIDRALGIPTGELTSEPFGLNVGGFYYEKPGPAVLDGDLGNDNRFCADIGGVNWDDDSRFGGAQWQPNLNAVVLEKGSVLFQVLRELL